mgnify:CR=1 FL=1|tara:strand:- start:446 stop:628 length:183 start_codon:yes stop_codon:yes gene_type:complete
MEREEIELEIRELRKNLNEIIEKLMSQDPEAQNIVGQIQAYKKTLHQEGFSVEECGDLQG